MALTKKILPDLCAIAVIVFLTTAVLGQVVYFEFVNFDDNIFVTHNPMVQKGLTAQNTVDVFARPYYGLYHPLTWLSHMLDVELFGLEAGGHHLTNLLFHILNSLLLYTLFRMTTRTTWPALFVALLFAVHPLHVEPVAWISSRKDVLSTFFGILALMAYSRYGQSRSKGMYAAALAAYVCALMGKPMAITLPFVMLLMDFWPLRRTENHGPRAPVATWSKLIAEKAPFFLVMAVFTVIMLYASRTGGSMRTLDEVSLVHRLSSPPVNYAAYLFRTIWPINLAAPYPLQPTPPHIGIVAGSLVLLIAVTVACWAARRRAPYLIAGWLWFLGMLVPVIGVVRIGNHATADRYTYVPLIGIFFAVVYGVYALSRRSRAIRYASVAAGAAAIAVSSYLTWLQAGHWRDTVHVFRRAIDVTENADLAHTGLGHALFGRGAVFEAEEHFRKAIEINPANPDAHIGYGRVLRGQGALEAALPHFEFGVEKKPDDPIALNHLGVALMELGRLDEAERHLREALRLAPEDELARNNLGNLALQRGDIREAKRLFGEVLERNPKAAETISNLGAAYLMDGDPFGAAELLEQAIALKPDDAMARLNYAISLDRMGRYDEALRACRRALEIDPGLSNAIRFLNHLESRGAPLTQ